MLTILGKTTSINVRKVLWTCAELGLPFQQEDWGIGFQPTSSPEFLALNPNGMVPVIKDGDVVLWESNTICRYLAGKHQRFDLLPQDYAARAGVEKWMDWQVSDLNNSWRYAFMSIARQHPDYTDQAQVNASITQWNRMMSVLENQLARTGAYVTGEQFTLADVVLGLSVNRWYMTVQDHRPELAAVQRYYQLLSQRPAYLLYGNNGTV